MKNESIYHILIGTVIGGIIVWIAATSGLLSFDATGQGMMRFGAENKSTSQATDTINAHFIEQMIPHHEDAITMAQLAQTKAKRPEVKKLADAIISSQSKEISEMKSWYKEWFGRELPTGDDVMNVHGMMGSGAQNSSHMGMMGDASDMEKLEQSDDFDREFVEEMIPHHQMAVMMASMLRDGTVRPEMKQLADDIITAQSDEITLMRGWLRTWENEDGNR